MGKRVAVVGTGQTKCNSGRKDVNGQEMINEAVQRALQDAELTKDDIDAVVIDPLMSHFGIPEEWRKDASLGNCYTGVLLMKHICKKPGIPVVLYSTLYHKPLEATKNNLLGLGYPTVAFKKPGYIDLLPVAVGLLM